MKTLRRLLVPSLVAFGVTTAGSLMYMTDSETGLDPETLGIALAFALAVVLAVLVVILLAVGLLRLLGVRSAWAALGLAFGVVAAGCLLYYVTDTLWGEEGEQWDLLFLIVTAVATIPSWIAHAAGLAIGDRRDHAARERAVGPTT